MLLTLLTAMTSVMFFVSAVLAAKHATAGFGGYALAITIGSSLAIGNAWMLNKLADILAGLTNSYSETRQDWIGGVFFIFTFLWGLVGMILIDLATSAAIRMVA